MSDYFPPEIVEKILLKLPAKSLIRFTTVCKSWRSTITSPSFISSHLYKPTNETLLLGRYDKQEQYYLLEVSKSRPFTITSSSQLEFPLKSQFRCLAVGGYCRGVVCLFNDCKRTIILCNPCIKKHFVLPKPTIHSDWPRFSSLGFGVAHDDFKVVRLVYCRLPGLTRFGTQAEVFSLREGRWRSLEVDVRPRTLFCVSSNVFLNGAMHWIGYNPVENEDVSILLFRVAQEVFDEIKLPNGLPIGKGHRLTMTLFGESLAVIRCGKGSCEVWFMKEYGVEQSWTKLYSFKLVGMYRPLTLRKNGEALMISQSQRNELVAFDLENVEAKNLGIRGKLKTFYIENYVESLELLLTGVS